MVDLSYPSLAIGLLHSLRLIIAAPWVLIKDKRRHLHIRILYNASSSFSRENVSRDVGRLVFGHLQKLRAEVGS